MLTMLAESVAVPPQPAAHPSLNQARFLHRQALHHHRRVSNGLAAQRNVGNIVVFPCDVIDQVQEIEDAVKTVTCARPQSAQVGRYLHGFRASLGGVLHHLLVEAMICDRARGLVSLAASTSNRRYYEQSPRIRALAANTTGRR